METIDKHYDFSEDPRIYQRWIQNGFAHSKEKPNYIITLPPPNITGVLHMGHALNTTIQDILIRWKKLQGYDTLWIPGIDHAGIATQHVIERQLVAEKKTRFDVGREALIDRIWEWKEQNGTIIFDQIKQLGCLCDWDRSRFTMDPKYQDVVRRAFIELYEAGLIYRGERLINWCPRCETSLSNEEVKGKEITGKLYFIRYPLVDGTGFLTIATSRPETMFGDVAIACNPDDERYKKYIGSKVRIPIINREIPVIADTFVDPHFGTGLVKITPSSDFRDAEVGKQHHLDPIKTIDSKGHLCNTGSPKYDGMYRAKARNEILMELFLSGSLEKDISYPTIQYQCYRCETEIEPFLSKQWFVKMKPLADLAIERVDELNFHPEHYRKTYLNWLTNIQDWCISRQIWWGHQIPVYHCSNPKCSEIYVVESKPDRCSKCGSSELIQDSDVLDTWFSSWLWPFAVGETDFPQSVIVSGFDIIFFWIARMIMGSLFFTEQLPFKDVYLHGVIRDGTNQKMSKSKGNPIDPVSIIKNYGADALRFSLILKSPMGSDTKLDPKCFELGKSFKTKLWNAFRYVQSKQVESRSCDDVELNPNVNNTHINQWILSRLHSTIQDLTQYLSEYNFAGYADYLQRFIWSDFCSFYLEVTKFYSDPTTVQTLRDVFKAIVILTHPIMPFITEKIWITGIAPAGIAPAGTPNASILNEAWPQVDSKLIDKELETNMEKIRSRITEIRGNMKEFSVLMFTKPKLLSELDYMAKLTNTEITTTEHDCVIKRKE